MPWRARWRAAFLDLAPVDFYLPREAAILTRTTPRFERVLRRQVQHPVTLTQSLNALPSQ